jgi:hypothetical protein
MATGESITPGTDIIMQTTAASQPAIGASIDPTNYYGQSFVYDEWVKSKIKDLNQAADTDEEKALAKVADQQATYKDIADKKSNELKEELESLTPLINEKTDKFKSDNSVAIDPMGSWVQDRSNAKQFEQESANAKAIIMKDPEIRGSLGYDSDTGRKYGSIEDWQVYNLVAKKFPDLAKYWPQSKPYGAGNVYAASFTGYSQNSAIDENGEPLSKPSTSIGSQAGNTTTPSGQLITYQQNVEKQKASASDAIEIMKNATTQEKFDAAQKQYDNAIQALKDASKQDISKITTWTDVKYAQGYGQGGKVSSDVYGDLANQKYNLQQSIASQVSSSQSLNSALNGITESGGRLNAEQLQDLGNMRNQVVSQMNDLNLVNAKIKLADAQNAYIDHPSQENYDAAIAAIKNTNAVAYINSLGSSNYLQNLSGVNVIGKSDNMGTLNVNSSNGQLYRSGLNFGDNKIELSPIAPIVGSIGGSAIYGSNKGGEIVQGIKSTDFNNTGISKLSDVNKLIQQFNKTGEYNVPYGSIYQTGKIIGSHIDTNDEFGRIASTVIDSPVQGNKLANKAAEIAEFSLRNTLASPTLINSLYNAPSIGTTKIGNLPIVKANNGDEMVLPNSGSPIKLSDFNALSPDDKSVMVETPDQLIAPGANQSIIDIINASVKYGGGPSTTNLQIISNRLSKIDPLILNSLEKNKSLMSDKEYKTSIDIMGKRIATGNVNDLSDTKILSGIAKNMVEKQTERISASAPTPFKSTYTPNVNKDVFGNSNIFDISSKNNISKSSGSNITSTVPQVNISNVTAGTSIGSPSKTGLSGVLIGNSSLSNFKSPSSGLNLTNIFGTSKKKSEGNVAFRKSKVSNPKIDVKKHDKKYDKKIDQKMHIDTKIKSEIPGINIQDLKFIRGNVANNRVGVIDTEIIKVNDMFKIPMINIGNKKRKVK